MANISTELTSIASDTRGEDVRDSFVSACQKINEESLPDVTAADVGKILAVNSEGEWSASSIIPVLSSIAVTTQPTKTSYVKGDALDLTGVVITATRTSDLVTETDIVTSSCVFDPADETVLSEAGTITVGVSYTENNKTVTSSFNITVAEPEGET